MARVVIVVEEMRYAGRLETGYFWQIGMGVAQRNYTL